MTRKPQTRKLSPPGIASRQAAASLLTAVLRKKTPLDRALIREMSQGGLGALSPRDKAFARLLAVTALRRKGQVEDALARFMKKPLPVKAESAHRALQLGAVELLFLDAPAHAAVSSAVAVAVTDRHAVPFKGLVNAVLRRVALARSQILESQDAPALNVPSWLRESWAAAYGGTIAHEIACALLTTPALDITPKGAGDAEAMAGALDARVLPTGSLRRPLGGAIEALPGFAQGQWWVQDAAAALPVTFLGDVKGRPVIDLCAAPGGKTAQLAARGARVTALDRAGGRLRLIEQNLKRLDLSARLVEADARHWRPAEPTPFVVLDAPCTATGTIRRHPDVMHLKRPEDLKNLLPLQARLLDAATEMMAPGGLLIYCTCSLQVEEGEQQIQAFLSRHRTMRRRPITPDEVGGCASFITPSGDLRTLPSQWPECGGLDGFFAARLVKS